MTETQKSTLQWSTTVATPSDAFDLNEFGKIEFTRTFGHTYTEENLNNYLNESYTTEKYLSWINNPSFRIWLARRTSGNEVVGYILCGPCGLPLENCQGSHDASQSGEVKRMYIHPSAFGTGLAAELLTNALEWLKGRYHDKIYLGVWSENYRAQKFYAKFGFEKIGEYGFPVGEHIDLEFIMILRS